MQSTVVTATEMKNNFGHYLSQVIKGAQIVVTKKGKEVARVIPNVSSVSFLTDSLIGILPEDAEVESVKDERLKEKYGSPD